MKKLHQSFDIKSGSTEPKQPRFKRKSNSKSPNSNPNSNKSRDKSMQKFWMREVTKPKIHNLSLQQILSKRIQKSSDWSPPRRTPTPAKSIKQNQNKTLTQQQISSNHFKQIKELNAEIEKYQVYIRKQNEKLQKLKKDNAQLLAKNGQLQLSLSTISQNTKNLQHVINQLNQKNNQKDALIEILQKQQPALKKVKVNIFQNKTLQYQKQKEEFIKRIKQLESALSLRQKSPKKNYCVKQLMKSSSSTKFSTSDSEGCQQLFHHDKLQKQLYQLKQQLKRMQIASNCMQRKHFNQMQAFKQKKQKQYEQLKLKFKQFLQKYKICMKKITSKHIQDIKQQKVKRTASLQSFDSLAFSSEDQKQKDNNQLVIKRETLIS